MKQKKSRAPSHLSDEARQFFDEIANDYGINDTAGLQILRTAIEAFDRMQGARRIIEADGLTITDKFGQTKAHPLLSVERDSRTGFLSAIGKLNLSVEPILPGPGRPSGGKGA